MNYIGLLTKDEQSTLCEIVTGKEFKEIFKRNEREFVKLQRGFRAKSLTDQRALAIASANIDSRFVATCVNARVEQWLGDIQANIARFVEKGSSHITALAAALIDSVFADHIELYFTLAEKPLDESACKYLYERMEEIRKERAGQNEVLERTRAIEEENRRLSEQVESAQRTADGMISEYEERVHEIEREKGELSAMLAEAKASISELQSAPRVFGSNDEGYRELFDDTNASALRSDREKEVTSLCSVYTDYSGKKWLLRHADLDSNGRYEVFVKDENLAPYYSNRGNFYYEDGPSTDGFYGVWSWSADENKYNPSKDYVRSRYNTELDAIELFIFTQATSLYELASLLKGGVDWQPHSRRIMFAFPVSKGEYVGILCAIKDLNVSEGKSSIQERVNAVPVYEFTDADILPLSSGLFFYKNAFAGVPNRLYYLRTPLDVVKGIVMESISWDAYKLRALTRTERRAYKDFLAALPVDNITYRIGNACNCSNPAARELLAEFLSSANKYIDGDSLEDRIVLSAISASAELQDRTKRLLREDWEKENEMLLTEAQQKLNLLRAELGTVTENLNEAQAALNKTKAEDERIAGIIAEKEKLAEDVERAVAERIQKASENAADFVASMAFFRGQQAQLAGSATCTSNEVEAESNIPRYCVYPELESPDELCVHHSWADVITTAGYELAEAGVAQQHIGGFAAFLCAAYIEKQPVLLIGPNAIDIAEAFSAAVAAHKRGVLDCEGSYSRREIEKIGAGGEDIVIINNLLAGGWMNRLPEILSNRSVFYIATYPYSEDVQVEPKSLFGFVLPLFTEFLVEQRATGKYVGGYFSDDFTPYSAKNHKHREPPALSRLAPTVFSRKQISRLVATMHDIYPDATADDDFLFCVFPIAYASLEISELADAVAGAQNGLAISASLRRELSCVLGEGNG